MGASSAIRVSTEVDGAGSDDTHSVIELLRAPLFADRGDAGRELGERLEAEGHDAVVVGLARGGVVVAAEVAARLSCPLDVVAVRKVGHPWQPEYAIGAVTPEDGVYVRGPDGLSEEQVEAIVARTKVQARELDARLHESAPPVALAEKTCILVDDGLATGATMIAAARWARGRGAARVVAAVPVGASDSLRLLEHEVDALVCPHARGRLGAVGIWYASFPQVEDAEVRRLLAAGRGTVEAPAG